MLGDLPPGVPVLATTASANAVLDPDGAVKRVKGGGIAAGQPWTYEAERYEWVARQRKSEQQAMSEYASTTVCRMEFLPRQPDDEGAKPCGRCDNCAGARFTTNISMTAMDAAGIDLDRAGVEGGAAPHGADRPSDDRR